MKEVIAMLKKYQIIVLGLLLISGFIFAGKVSNSEFKPNKNKFTEPLYSEIAVNDYIELLEEDKMNVIFIGRPTCPYCRKASVALSEIIDEYDIDVYYVNSSKMTDSDRTKFNNSNEIFNDGNWGVPIVMITKNNTVVEYINGFSENDGKQKYINLLKRNKIIE